MRSSTHAHRRHRAAAAALLAASLLLGACGPRNADAPKPPAATNQDKAPPQKTPPAKPAALAEFAIRPPEVLDIQVTPLSDGATDNARLEIRFAPDKRLGKSLAINIGERPVEFVRSREQPDVFAATITMDLKALQDELAEARKFTEQHPKVLRFRNRELVGEVDARRLELRGADVRVHDRPIRLGIDVSRLGAFIVDPARELLVTATSVVDDPARTFDPCTNAGTKGGAWTFAKLMRDMANQPASGIAAEDFVANWLASWNTVQATGSFDVPPRAEMMQLVSDWPKLANGKLDLERAPFRLLAIVNRLDLRTGSAYASGDAGEGRFVFGVVDQNATGACAASSQLPFTVIFEYKVPIGGCQAVHDYAAQWRALGDIALGDAAFNPALQAITDRFAAANAAPGQPNGSAIGQIRTNENALAPEWELREFKLQADHQLHTVSPAQVPQTSLNNTPQVADFITANAAHLALGAVDVPQKWPLNNGAAFQAGSSLNGPPVIAWKGNTTTLGQAEARFHFSLGTCNSCHGREVQNPLALSRDTFLHVRPRAAGGVSSLSTFLLGDGTLQAPSTHAFVDPVFNMTRNIGDLADRQGKLAGASGRCLSLGLIEEIRFQPLRFVH
jgi:hypothetical protein